MAFRQIDKCTCPLCGKKIDGMNYDTDLYFDLSAIVVSERNNAFILLDDKKRKNIKNVLNVLKGMPMWPMKIRQTKLIDYSEISFHWTYTLQEMLTEVSKALIFLAAKRIKLLTTYSNSVLIDKMKKRLPSGAGEDLIKMLEGVVTLSRKEPLEIMLGEDYYPYDIYKSASLMILDIIEETSSIDSLYVGSITKNEVEILKNVKDHKTEFTELFGEDSKQIKLYDGNLKIEGDTNHRVGNLYSIVETIRTEDNGVMVNKRRCPKCNFSVSQFSGAYKEKVLVTFGYPRVSKSTTIAANLYFLETNVAPILKDDSGRTDSNQKDLTGHYDIMGWKEFNDQYYTPYKNGYKVTATGLGLEAIPRFSVVVNLPGNKDSFLLTIIDIPGEYALDTSWTIAAQMYVDIYESADYLWYCTDLSETEKIATNAPVNRVPILKSLGFMRDGSVRRPIRINEIERLWTDSTSPINKLANNKKLRVMIVIGKTDVYPDLAGSVDADGNDLYQDNYNESIVYNNNEFLYIDENKMFKFMEKWRNYLKNRLPVMINQFDNKFRHEGGYCAMSAYGFPPNDGVPESEISLYDEYCTLYEMDKLSAQENGQNFNYDLESYLEKEKKFNKDRQDNVKKALANIRQPNPYMAGWPVLWLMICEGKVKLLNKVIKRSILPFRDPEFERKYFTIKNPASRANIMMDSSSGRVSQVNHSSDEEED